jgi:hypothetical protein
LRLLVIFSVIDDKTPAIGLPLFHLFQGFVAFHKVETSNNGLVMTPKLL